MTATNRRLARIVALAAALASMSGTAQAATLTLGSPVTDNYKDSYNDPDGNRELRTWLATKSVTVGGVTFKPATLPPSGWTSVGADAGLAMRGSDGTNATLTANTTSTNVLHQGFFRIDANGDFGLLQELKSVTALQSAPIRETFTLARAGTTLASAIADYTYESAIANAPTTSIEYNGPGGRWYAGGAATRLDWETAPPPPAPVGQPDRGVTVSAAASAVTGDEVTVTAKVLNRTAAAGSVNVAIAAANAKLLGVSAAGLSCTMSACSGTLAANATVTISATLGATSAGSATLTARLTDADSTPNDNTATATTSVTGPACTYAGTSGADSAQGSAANEVFCLFGGDDTVTPGAGGDTIIGGAGTDRLSYWNAAGAVVINLGQSAAWDAGAGTAIGWDTYRGIEWATGSAYADTLVGSAGSDILDGLEGTDEIWGYGGNDTLKGWVGNDRLYGGDGNDTLDGGDGTDSCDQGLGTGTKTACEA
jgi:Ca2+-binding RTX toxin-like protein